MTEWENHFNCVSRDKIVREILYLRKKHDKLKKDDERHFTESDTIYLNICVLEDLLR